MTWSLRKRGRASGKVAEVKVQESSSESRQHRRREEPTEVGGRQKRAETPTRTPWKEGVREVRGRDDECHGPLYF